MTIPFETYTFIEPRVRATGPITRLGASLGQDATGHLCAEEWDGWYLVAEAHALMSRAYTKKEWQMANGAKMQERARIAEQYGVVFAPPDPTIIGDPDRPWHMPAPAEDEGVLAFLSRAYPAHAGCQRAAAEITRLRSLVAAMKGVVDLVNEQDTHKTPWVLAALHDQAVDLEDKLDRPTYLERYQAYQWIGEELRTYLDELAEMEVFDDQGKVRD